MKTFTITKAHIRDGRYIGPDPKFDGNVVIEAGLGRIWFERLSAKGSIIAGAGSDIKVDGDISVFGDFTVVDSVTSGDSIWVGDGFTTGGDITVGDVISVGGRITAKTVSAGLRITAVKGVKVVGGFPSGDFSEAGAAPGK